MKRLQQELEWLLTKKIYVFALACTVICGYGFGITHPSIGIDDTALDLYLQDGLMVEVGRWTMFLVNKIFHFGDFAPFLTELVGVLFLSLGASLFCIWLRRLFGEGMNVVCCTIFSCVFVSNPMISAVFIYYFHNGIGIGYTLTALSLIWYQDVFYKKGKKRLASALGSLICLWVAAGCYESFVIVYILGVMITLMVNGSRGLVPLHWKSFIGGLGLGAVTVLLTMLLRGVAMSVIGAVFQLQASEGVTGLRSLSDMLSMFTGEGLQELIMFAKRFWVVYHVNAFVYLPVTGYEIACFAFGIYALAETFRKKKPWYLLLAVGMVIAPFLLVIIETKVTFYRTSQYLPFFAAVGMVLIYQAVYGMKKWRFCKNVVAFLMVILVYNQATQLNQNFYRDYQQYQYSKELLVNAALDAERAYGKGIPIVFTGSVDIPYEFLEDYYISYDSWQYACVAAVTDLVDVHLKEKYHQPQGYCFVGEGNLPMIRWGLDAFDGTNRELIHFLEMHGYPCTTITDLAVLEEARKNADALPHYPMDGSIVLQDGYILVNF